MKNVEEDDWETNKENINCNISRDGNKEILPENNYEENWKEKENTANLLWKKWNIKMQTVFPGKNYLNPSENKSSSHRKKDSAGSIKDLSSFQ